MHRTRNILRTGNLDAATQAEVFQALCLDLSENVHGDLISIWFFNRSHTQLVCKCHYDAITQKFGSGLKLHQKDYPHYFQTIVEDTFICAPNVQTNPATKELTSGYFAPNGIKSLLDYILHENFKPIGIICCENRANIRNWSEPDKRYLRALAALASHRFHFSSETDSQKSA